MCVCACHPRWLANKTWLYQRSETSLLFPPSSFALCPLSASAASAQFEKQSSKSIITACAIRCWRLFFPPSLLERGSKPPAFWFQVCFCNPPLRLLPLYAPPPPSACAIAQFLWHRVSSPYLRQRRRRRRLQLCKLPAR